MRPNLTETAVCSVCEHTPRYCYCDSSRMARADLNRIAVSILFDYDLSEIDQEVVESVRSVLRKKALEVFS